MDLEALQAPEGLQLERKSVREETVEVDGREVELRHYVFRFFSQRFLGGGYRERTEVGLPRMQL